MLIPSGFGTNVVTMKKGALRSMAKTIRITFLVVRSESFFPTADS